MKQLTKAGAVVAAGALFGVMAAGAQEAPASESALAGPAIAERLYVSPMASYTFADSARHADDSLGWALTFGKQMNRYFNVEVSGFGTKFDAEDGPGSQKLKGYGMGGMIFPFDSAPNLYGLVAGHYVDQKGTSDAVAFDAGLGYLIGPFNFLNDGSLRAEARYRHSSADDTVGEGNNNTFDEPVLNLGLLIPLGSAPKPPEPAPVAPVAVVVPVAICADGQDNDGDGQTDFPNDPGCTAADDGDETDPAQCSDGKDNDGDGLIDFPSDKGCSAADDNDEVDPCKTPAPGEVISLKGCGTGDIIVLKGVNFEFDQSRLTANAKTILDGVATELAAYPEIKIELGGHTDAKGSDEYNQALSEKRAAAVVSYLRKKGVAGDRMTSAGYGESKPVADNETDEGRELNRRVELKVTEGAAPAASVAAVTTDAAPTADAAAPAADPATTDGATPDAAPVPAAADAPDTETAPVAAP